MICAWCGTSEAVTMGGTCAICARYVYGTMPVEIEHEVEPAPTDFELCAADGHRICENDRDGDCYRCYCGAVREPAVQ